MQIIAKIMIVLVLFSTQYALAVDNTNQAKKSSQKVVKKSQDKSIKKKVVKPKFKTKWQKLYGGDRDDIGVDSISMGKNSIVLGTCKSYETKKSNICVTKIDSNGDTLWKNVIRHQRKDTASKVTLDKDGNIIILGTTKSFSSSYDNQMYLAKLSPNGKIIWEKHFGGKRDEFGKSLVATGNSIVMVGESESYNNGQKDIYIVKVDTNGKIIFAKVLGGDKEEIVQDIAKLKDGGFIIVGSKAKNRRADTDFMMLKIDSKGNKIWFKAFGGGEDDILNAVHSMSDGGFIIAGSTRSYQSSQKDTFTARLNKNGKVIWDKILGFDKNEEAHDIAYVNNKIIIAGSTNTLGKGDYDAYVLAINPKGKLLYSNTYGGTEKDIAMSVSKTYDNHILVIGKSDSFTKSRVTNFYMLKLK